MVDPASKPLRKPRADAARNRERLLEAAKTVLGRGGTDASLDAVALTAGLGIGTLYRHFPTREALYEAVYRREVEQLAELARVLAAPQETSDQVPSRAAFDGLRCWVQALVEFVSTKKGMAAALALGAHKPPELMACTGARLHEAVGLLLRSAADAGQIRHDIGPEDLLRMVVGICYLQDGPGWQVQVMRLLDIFLDGMCHGPVRPPVPS